MGDFLPFLSHASPAGIVGLGVIMMMFGWLVPVSVMNGRLKDKDIIIKSKDDLIASLERNNKQLLSGNTTTVQLVDAMASNVQLVGTDGQSGTG